MSEPKDGTIEEPEEKTVDTPTPSDPKELVRKLLAQIKSELEAKDPASPEAKAGESDVPMPPLPAEFATELKAMMADMLVAKKQEDEAKALAEVERPKLERRGMFYDSKAGGLQMDYKTMVEERPSFDEESKHIQRLNDDVMLLAELTKCHPSRFVTPKGRQMAAELKQRCKGWCETKANALYSTGTDVGDEWVPTGYSADLYEFVEIFGDVEPQFESFVMPNNPYVDPIQEALPDAYLAGEATDAAPTALVASTPTTGNQTYTAKTLAVRIPFSAEFSEDSIIASLASLRMACIKALAYGGENAIINGQASGAIDTALDTSAIAANDCRMAFDGLRYMALLAEDETGTTIKKDVSGGALSYTYTSRMKAAMKKFAARIKELRFFSGVSGAEQIFRFTECRTMDKYGQNATMVKGEVANLRGVPLIISEVMSEAQNASGVVDGVTKTMCSLLLANVSCFKIGNRRDVLVESEKDIKTQQFNIVATRRMAFAPRGYTPGSATHGHMPVNVCYDILTDSTT